MDIGSKANTVSAWSMNLEMNLSRSVQKFQAMMEHNGRKQLMDVSIETITFEFKLDVASFSSENISNQADLWRGIDLSKTGYEGKKPQEMSPEEAMQLISEDGFFGIKQTAKRLVDFVMKGAAGNETMLRAGREGIMEGLREAEKLWGGKLPDISYQTINQTIKTLDEMMREMGFRILETRA